VPGQAHLHPLVRLVTRYSWDAVVTTADYASFRDRLLAEWHDYGDRAAALAALGLLMTDDPVQIFTEAVDALNRIDRDELTRLVDPEIVFIPMRAAVTGAYIGHSGINDFLSDNDDMFELFRADFETLEPLADGRLLSIGTITVRGKGGEEETVVKTAGIATFRAGRMLSWHDYGDEKIARAKAAER
jgi:SnoaL-like domain